MTSIKQTLAYVKPEVHRQHPYTVGVPPGEIVVKLNQNESPYDLPEELKDAISVAWDRIAFNRYPLEQPRQLTSIIADYIGWDRAGIIIGNGSNELTFSLGLTFISSGTKVVLPRPMFSFYERVVDIFGGEIVSVPPHEDLSFDTDGLIEAIRRTRPPVVVITSPNNPTSLAVPVEEIISIATAAPGLVLIDEAYVEFSDEPSMLTRLNDFPNVVLLRTFSKAFGLAGLRLGYLIGHPELMSEIMKVRTPFMIDRFSASAVIELLLQPHLIQNRIDQIRTQTSLLIHELQQISGIRPLKGQANFVTFEVTGDSQKLFHSLAKNGVLVRDMSGYSELKGYLRVSTGTPAENRAFLDALTNLIL